MLSEHVRTKSFDGLLKKAAKFLKKDSLSDDSIKLLERLNYIAAGEDLVLNEQSDKVLGLVWQQLTFIEKQKQSHDTEVIAVSLFYNNIVEQIQREVQENKKMYAAAGSFSSAKLHERSFLEQLQDDDMTVFMPKSNGKITVLSALNINDTSSESILEGLKSAIENPEIRHIIIPIGPEHWRGIYLTKPNDDKENYRLELYDSYGKKGASAIYSFTLNLLIKCGIEQNKVTIEYSEPQKCQTDIYSCGDFTCAYSHKKMKQFGAQAGIDYSESYIKVLEENGNIGGALRRATRTISKEGFDGLAGIVEKSLMRPKLPETTSCVQAEVSAIAAPCSEVASVTHESKEELKPVRELVILLGEKIKKLSAEILKLNRTSIYKNELSAKKSVLEDVVLKIQELCVSYDTNNISLDDFKIKANVILTQDTLISISNHRGFGKINSIIRALIGVVATLTLAPALIVHQYSKAGYRQTFFGTPKTESAKLVDEINKKIQNIPPTNPKN